MRKSQRVSASSRRKSRKSGGPKDFLDFASSHFVSVSALVIVVAVAAATVALGAFLSAFDWHLIWVIDYASVLKWGLPLVGLGLFVASVIAIMVELASRLSPELLRRLPSSVSNLLNRDRLSILFAIAVAAVCAVYWVISDWPLFTIFPIFILAFVLSFLTLTLMEEWPNVEARTVLTGTFLILAAAYALGHWSGDYHRYNQGFIHDVTMKDDSKFRAGLVMVTDRYIVLWDRDHAIVLPATEIARIEGHSQSAR